MLLACRPSSLDSPGDPAPAGHRNAVNEYVARVSEELGAARARGRRRSAPATRSRSGWRRRPFDIVHVHEPFAPRVSSTALRHSFSLNVATFHAPQERVLSTQVARPLVEIFFGRLDARTVGDAGHRASCSSATSPAPTRWSKRAGRARLGRGRGRAGGDLPAARGAPPRRRRRRRGAAADRRAAADRGRPAHAHRPLARLRDPGRGAARDGPRPRPGGDRDHRPQRGLRGAGGAQDRRARWATSR